MNQCDFDTWAEWYGCVGADGWLALIGSLIGAIVTGLAVYLAHRLGTRTVKDAERNRRLTELAFAIEPILDRSWLPLNPLPDVVRSLYRHGDGSQMPKGYGDEAALQIDALDELQFEHDRVQDELWRKVHLWRLIAGEDNRVFVALSGLATAIGAHFAAVHKAGEVRSRSGQLDVVAFDADVKAAQSKVIKAVSSYHEAVAAVFSWSGAGSAPPAQT